MARTAPSLGSSATIAPTLFAEQTLRFLLQSQVDRSNVHGVADHGVDPLDVLVGHQPTQAVDDHRALTGRAAQCAVAQALHAAAADHVAGDQGRSPAPAQPPWVR